MSILVILLWTILIVLIKELFAKDNLSDLVIIIFKLPELTMKHFTGLL